MRLISVRLRNFRQHRDARIEFPDGVTGILGPNGAGKTTILEAISWALYGQVAARGNKDTIKCDSAPGGEDVLVEVTFEFGGHTYTVARGLDKANLRVDGAVTKDGITEVAEGIRNLLRMDYQAFFNSFFTRQKELAFMANMEPRERARAISRMLGYERATRARAMANDAKLGYAREIAGLEAGLGDPDEIERAKREATERLEQAKSAAGQKQEQVVARKQALQALRPRMEESEAKSKRHDELCRAVENARQASESLRERTGELEKDLEQLKREKKELDALQPVVREFESLQKERDVLVQLQKSDSQRQNLAGQLATLEAEIGRLVKEIGDGARARTERDAAARKLTDAEDRLRKLEAAAQNEREDLLARRQGAEAELRECRKREEEIAANRRAIEEAGEEGNCPTCERPLGDELSVVLGNLDRELAELSSRSSELTKLTEELGRKLEADAEAASKERVLLSGEVEKLREAKSQYDAAIQHLDLAQVQLNERQSAAEELRRQIETLPSGFDQKRLDDVMRRGREIKGEFERANLLRASVARLPQVEANLAAQRQRLQQEEKRLADATSSLEELAFDPEEHQKLRSEFEAASALVQEAEVELERRLGDVKAEQARLDEAAKQEESYRARKAVLDKLRKKRLHAQTLTEALDAFRDDLNRRIRPTLERKTAEILTELTDGRYTALEIDDNYNATVLDDGERRPVISGGEDDVVNLSLRLAISEMIAERAGQPLSLLILDEVFGSLDEGRRENVVALLQNLKNRFQQIILITHIEPIHEMVDNCIWVERDERERVSRITERVEAAAVTITDSDSRIAD